MTVSNKFAGLAEAFSDYEKARYVVLPVPYEKTTSYGKGTVNGPEAIIEASRFMELYDEELMVNTAESGIATLKPLVVDDAPEILIEELRKSCAKILKDGKFPVVLGGEHSISLGVLLAVKEFYKEVTVLQFDAHTDLRDEYGGSKYSHACVMRRIREHVPAVQVGIRSYSDDEVKTVERERKNIFLASEMHERDCVKDIISRLGKNVYVTFDVDAFDPSIMPSTGTPEPGGLGWYEVLRILREVSKTKNIVGFDAVELAPNTSVTAPDYMVARLVYRVMGYVNPDYLSRKNVSVKNNSK
jgi:agmatinase